MLPHHLATCAMAYRIPHMVLHPVSNGQSAELTEPRTYKLFMDLHQIVSLCGNSQGEFLTCIFCFSVCKHANCMHGQNFVKSQHSVSVFFPFLFQISNWYIRDIKIPIIKLFSMIASFDISHSKLTWLG